MENKKTRIIGRTTFGLSLILFGISLVIQTFCSADILRYVLLLWPLIIISIGAEIIYYSNKDTINTKYDFLGIILTGLIIFFGIMFSLLNYGVNKILYSDTISSYINSKEEDFASYTFDSDLKIINFDDEKIKLKIMEEPNYDDVKVVLKYTINHNTNENNIISLLSNRNYDIFQYIHIDHLDDEIATLEILNIPEVYESLELIITTNSKDRITLSGNFDNF